MKNLCPRCRASRKDEAVVVSLVSVWFSCTRCEWVWRGSILQLAVGCVSRGVGLPVRSRMGDVKIQTEVRPSTTNAPYDLEVSKQLGSLEHALAKQNELGDGISTSDDEAMTDDVASWLGEQESVKHSPVASVTVDSLIEMMDAQPAKIADDRSPAPADRRTPSDDDVFFSSFGEEVTSSQPLRAAADRRAAPEASHGRSPVPDGRAPIADGHSPMADRRVPIDDGASKDELTSSVDQMLKNVDGVADAFVRLQQQFAGMERWCQELMNA